MSEPAGKWPFPPTDGGPLSRPLVVDLKNVLVAIVADERAAAAARTTLFQQGVPEQNLRLYTAEQIVAFDDEFRDSRGLRARLVGALSMTTSRWSAMWRGPATDTPRCGSPPTTGTTRTGTSAA
jgi:hypothetical protein